jgi:CelD/BcsL family acetyltransferase involved in cellulose biosynthesis
MTPHMRRHSKNYISRIIREFGNYTFNTFEKNNIPISIINRIVDMNFLRMEQKNIIPGINDTYKERAVNVVRTFGFVSILEIKGEIVAGSIMYLIKNKCFVQIISSDPKFDKYNVGHTCLFLTIQSCIKREYNEVHLLWGNSPYKERFLANRSQLYSIFVFRSTFSRLKYRIYEELIPRLTVVNLLRSIKKLLRISLSRVRL